MKLHWFCWYCQVFYVLGFVFLLIRIGEILEWSCAIAPSLLSHIERKNSNRETVLLICIYNSCFVVFSLIGKIVSSILYTQTCRKNKRQASEVPLCLGKRKNVRCFLSFFLIFAEISVIFCHFLRKSAWQKNLTLCSKFESNLSQIISKSQDWKGNGDSFVWFCGLCFFSLCPDLIFLQMPVRAVQRGWHLQPTACHRYGQVSAGC